MSFLAPKPQTIAQPVMPKEPPIVIAPQGEKPKKKSQQPSFLGTEVTPLESNRGGNTLLGQ